MTTSLVLLIFLLKIELVLALDLPRASKSQHQPHRKPTKSFQEQGDRRLLYYLLSFRSMVWWLEILPRRRRRETSYDRSPNTASPERMSSMVTPVEVSVASTSRCRRWRLPERRRVLSRPIGTPSFVLLASRGQKSTRRAQSRPLRLDLSPPWLGSRRQVPIAGSDWKGSRMAASQRRTG